MGATAADTRREIEEIRKDISSAVGELTRRVTRAASPQTYLDFARENPAAIVGVGLAGVSVVGALFARSVAEARRQNRPSERLKRNVLEAAEGLSEGVQRALSAVPALPLEVSLGTADAKGPGKKEKTLKVGEPGMVKRMLWAALVAVMMAGGGLLARRVSATIWRSAMGEAPPTKNI